MNRLIGGVARGLAVVLSVGWAAGAVTLEAAEVDSSKAARVSSAEKIGKSYEGKPDWLREDTPGGFYEVSAPPSPPAWETGLPPVEERLRDLNAPGRVPTAEESEEMQKMIRKADPPADPAAGLGSTEKVWSQKGYDRPPMPGEKEKRPDRVIGNSPFLKDLEEAEKMRSR